LSDGAAALTARSARAAAAAPVAFCWSIPAGPWPDVAAVSPGVFRAPDDGVVMAVDDLDDDDVDELSCSQPTPTIPMESSPAAAAARRSVRFMEASESRSE
jgi:hypothetical protein